MFPKRATSFDRQSCEFSIFTRGPYERRSCHRQRPYRGFSDTSGEVIGTPSFGGGYPRRIASILGRAIDDCPPLKKRENTMRTTFTAHHNEHVSIRSFEEVVGPFESAVGYLGALDLRRY